MTYRVSETVAKTILQTAVDEERASDLLHCLFEGGTATVDVETGRLVLITANMLQALMQDDTQI